MSQKTGYDFKEFFSATPLATFTAAAARTAAAAATLVCDVSDVTVGRQRAKIQWKTKCGVQTKGGSIEKTVTVKMAIDYGGTVWGILTNAFDSGDPIFFASLTPDAATGKGIAGNFVVITLPENRPLEGVHETTIELGVFDSAEFVEVV